MAVPACLSVADEGHHVVYPADIHKLVGQLRMATDAIIHNDLRTGFLGLDGLRFAFSEKGTYVLHAVHSLKHPFLYHILMRDMAIVASGIPAVGAVHPGCIIGSHDVAVDTCRRVISQISVRPEKIHKQASAADEDTANNECRYFPPVGWK